jgi:hypothetical protein
MSTPISRSLLLGAQASPPVVVASLVSVVNAGRRGRLRSQQLLLGDWDVLLSFVA